MRSSRTLAYCGPRGAQLRYHGDFDAPGLAMAARAHTAGCAPFQMLARHYRDTVAAAAATPWDPDLAIVFEDQRFVVHQERVMDEVLIAHARYQ